MSQRPPASRPASSDGQRITLPPVQLRDDLRQEGRPAGRPQQPASEGQGFPQQPQQSPQHARTGQIASSGEDWRSAGPSRDLGVHSILNPTEPDSGSSRRRQSGNPGESPSAIGPPAMFAPSPTVGTPRTFPREQLPVSTPPAGEGYSTAYPRAPRRILTPRSPSRAVSAGRGIAQPAATIDAQQSPFLPSRGRSYIAEPGPSASSEVPPMPTPPGQSQPQQYGYPPSASTPNIAPRRTSGATMQAPGRTPLSQSASPSMSASSSQTSPASFLYHKGGQGHPATSSSYFPGSSFGTTMQQGSGGLQFQGPSGAPEGPYSVPAPQTGSSLHSSAGSSRQTSASDPIQVMTITTSQGSYTVPVDVHQASRLADEKRARNAGASARFRQRRKEKEREANVAIEKLQTQTRDLERKIREVEQERDFYRSERDRFRDVVFRTPEMRHLAMGPPSPQSMRAGAFPGSMGSMGSMAQVGGPPPPPLGYQAPESTSERPPRRRRTDTQGEFTSLPYTLPPASTLPPVQTTGYAPGPPNLPPLRMENPNATQLPPSSLPPSSLPPSTTSRPPPPYDPYARGPYERGWPGDGGRR